MKKKNFIFIFLVLSGILVSCTPSPDEAFNKLKQLEGEWKSSGNVIVFESWSLINDSTLKGSKYTKLAEEKLFLDNYQLQRRGDSVWLFMLHPEKRNGDVIFSMHKSRFGRFSFLNVKDLYPNLIHIDFIDDSTFLTAKENIRGNKRIEFEMKRWKE